MVVVHPGAASGSRRWPVGRWQAVVRALVGRGHRVVVTGVPAERDLCALVAGATPGAEDWCGRLDLRGLAERVASARLLLCGDTGVAHVATAVGTPSVLLFGPTTRRGGDRRWIRSCTTCSGTPGTVTPRATRTARRSTSGWRGPESTRCCARRSACCDTRATADGGPGADGRSHADGAPADGGPRPGGPDGRAG